jgi:hypothetical protein
MKCSIVPQKEKAKNLTSIGERFKGLAEAEIIFD